MGLFSCIKDHQGVSGLGQCFVCWVGLGSGSFGTSHYFPIGSNWIDGVQIFQRVDSPSVHPQSWKAWWLLLSGVACLWAHTASRASRKSRRTLGSRVQCFISSWAFRVWVRVGCGAWVREHIIACQAKLGLCETWRGVSVFPPLFFYEAPRINLDWLCLILTQTFVETSSQAATQCNTSFLRTFGRAVSLCQSLACTYFVLPVFWRELLAIWLYF